MTATNEQQLQYFFKQLDEEEQKSVLQLLQTIVKKRTEPHERIIIETYNAEIEEALADIKSGNLLSHEEVVTLSKQW